MILTSGDVSSLAGLNWYALELTSERQTEAAIRRIGKGIPSIFREEPCEVFVPIIRRDLNVFELATGNMLYVRGNLKLLARLKTITGSTGLLTDGSGRTDHAIPIDDAFVQALILQCQSAFDSAHDGTQVGSFVRILAGESRDFCGTVTELNDSTAVVAIELMTKKIFLTTPLLNLMNLDEVPADRRTFYWSPQVAELEDAAMVESDLHWQESKVVQESTDCEYNYGYESRSKNPRSKTATVFVRTKVAEGLAPKQIAIAVVQALMDGTITKRPKSLFIIYNLIKQQWKKGHPEVKSRGLRSQGFTLKEMYAIGNGLGIPNETPPDQIANDGRQRRRKSFWQAVSGPKTNRKPLAKALVSHESPTPKRRAAAMPRQKE
jgi:hypothetical protein